MFFCFIIAELEVLVILGPNQEASFCWLLPGAFYLLNFILPASPAERPRAFGIRITRIAVNAEVVQSIYPPLLGVKVSGFYLGSDEP
jgi:hypothetical protein